MKPGRELDAFVAEKVMGWKKQEFVPGVSHEHRWHDQNGQLQISIHPYSTDIAAAWEVVEKFIKDGWEVVLNVSIREAKITLWNDAGMAIREGKAFGSSITHAICLAALKTVEQIGTEMKA
jgi:hypothetical protein